jgi:hypothetical protein
MLSGSSGVHAVASEADLLEPVRPYVRQVMSEFGQIAPERAAALKTAAAFIRERLAQGKPAQLTFICTHNSRRSHLAQIWSQTAAVYYGLTNVTTFSGGTEQAACNIRTVRALRRAGFSVVESTGGTNPVYLAKFAEGQAPGKLFSKVYSSEGNPQREFAALFCCDQADASCPQVQGAAVRIPIHYVDPKASDNSPGESATYDERCRQIAREMFYLMSAVSGGAGARDRR